MCNKIFVGNNKVINFDYVKELYMFLSQENNNVTAELVVEYADCADRKVETIETVHVNKPLDLKKLQRGMNDFLKNQIINASKIIMLDKASLYENLVELTGIKDVTMCIKAENNDTAIDGYVLLKDNRGGNLYLIWTGEVWDAKKARKELLDFYNITYTQSMPMSRVKELMYEYRYRIDRKDIYSMRSQVLTDKNRSKLIEDDIYKQIGEL